jgi:hypothetical protein
MPLTSAQRAWIAVLAFLAVIVAALCGAYYWYSHRPSTGPAFTPEIAGTPPDVLSMLPPDAPAVGYIDAEALRKLPNFPVGGFFSLIVSSPQAQHAYNQTVRETGFDTSRDLDHAAIAYWPTGFGTPENVLGKDRFIAVVDGRFDQEKIKSYVQRIGHVVTRGTQSIYEAPGNPPLSLEFISPTRLVIGGGRDATSLVADIISQGPRPRDAAMQGRLQKIAGAPMYAVARTDHLPQSAYAGFQNAPQLDQLARGVQAVTLVGQPVGDVLNLGLSADCDASKNALTISFLLEGGRMAASMAIGSPDAHRQMTREQIVFLDALVNQAKISQHGKQVRIAMNIAPAMLGSAHTK